MTQQLEAFRTQLSYEVSQIQDPNLLYKTYYTITSPRLETSVRDLFSSRKLSTDSTDFSYFVNEILPLNQYSVEDNQKFLKKMTDGELISSKYLSQTCDKVLNLRDLVDPMVTDQTLNKMVSHVADSLSSSSVGKGEFAFVLLTGNSTKAKKGGDLRIGDTDVEIKAKGAKLASQSSHVSLMATTNAVREYLGPKTEIKPLTPRNLNNHYLPALGSLYEVLQFLKYVFSLTMYRAENLDWILKCNSIEHFFTELAIKEFHYYKECDSFDRMLFVNPDNLNVYNTESMDEEKLKNFKLTRSFSFKSERIQTNNWTLI